MRGGNQGRLQECCARRLALAAVLGVLWSLSSGTTTHTARGANTVTDDCARQSRKEQSILVASSKSSFSAAADREARGGSTLEPIAVTSEHVPDLAEVEQDRLVPDLAGSRKLASNSKALQAKGEGPDAAASVKEEVLSFHGVLPGLSRRHEVLREWGDPRSEDTMAETLQYRFDKLRSVRVKFSGKVVDAIVVSLESPLSTESLINKLNLKSIPPALLADDAGDPLAMVFPERGVVLRYAGEGQIGEIVLQPIKAASYLLRAESNAKSNLLACREDLQRALAWDRTSAHARGLLSELHLTAGEAVTAERYAAEAIEIEPENDSFRLLHAKCLRQLARYDLAVNEARKVLESAESHSLVRAKALYEMSQLATVGSDAVAQRAVLLLTKSIDIADRLAIDQNSQVSQEAKELLVEAHLAMAVEIAKGQWSRKDQIVPQWIERASALSEEMIATEASNLPLRLQVAVSALAAAASLDTPIDPLLWIEEAEETVQLLNASSNDQETLAQFDWQLGIAYFHGAQVQHMRSEPESAERLGKLAVTRLEGLASQRDELPDTAYLMGRLYFQIGAVYAVHRNDHITACEWYDRGIEYLLNPVPVTIIAVPQQHGDALVSMGVSYWHTNRREDAIDATQSGVDLIEHAVQSGLLGEETLEVPYGNLAEMYGAQGKTDQATKYSRLAKNVTNSEMSSKPTSNKRG